MSANLIVDVTNTANYEVSAFANTNNLSGATTIGQIVDLLNSDTYCNLFVVAPGVSGVIQVQVQCTNQLNDAGSGSFWSGGGFPVSGAFTDPTSGLPQLPTVFQSGGNVYFNSGVYQLPGGGFPPTSGGNIQPLVGGYPAGSVPFGLTPIYNAQGGAYPIPVLSGGGTGGTSGGVLSGFFPVFASGGIGFAAFQRTGRWARANIITTALTAVSGTATTPIFAGFISQLDTTGSGGGFSWLPQSGGGNTASV
jgi:hypothetical protein